MTKIVTEEWKPESTKFQIFDKVRVKEGVDISQDYIGREGIVVSEDNPWPIEVSFCGEDGGNVGFNPWELELVKPDAVYYDLKGIGFNPNVMHKASEVDKAFLFKETPEGSDYWWRFCDGKMTPAEEQEAYAKWDAMKKQWDKENNKPDALKQAWEELEAMEEQPLDIVAAWKETNPKCLSIPTKSDGGPSSYYDFKDTYHTLNDWMEDKAKEQWGAYSLHMKDLIKGATRFGTKAGVGVGYDINKMLYSAIRMKVMEVGKQKTVEYILSVLEDKQFK